MRIPFAVLILLLSAIGLQAQGFPWNDFKERKVEDMISITTKAVRPDDSMFLATNTLNSRTEVTFTGQSRPISKSRQFFLQWWAGSLRFGLDYAALYDKEYLYKEGDKEYWLPTQGPVTKYFDKELKPNDKMILFLISAGAYRDNNTIDCVVLVEEYQLPQNLDKVIKKPSN